MCEESSDVQNSRVLLVDRNTNLFMQIKYAIPYPPHINAKLRILLFSSIFFNPCLAQKTAVNKMPCANCATKGSRHELISPIMNAHGANSACGKLSTQVPAISNTAYLSYRILQIYCTHFTMYKDM